MLGTCAVKEPSLKAEPCIINSKAPLGAGVISLFFKVSKIQPLLPAAGLWREELLMLLYALELLLPTVIICVSCR